MSGMHLLPVYYTTTSTKRRKKRNKTKSLIAAEKEHAKFLKKMGVGKSKGGRSSVGRASGLQPEGRRFDPVWLHQFFSAVIVIPDLVTSFPKRKLKMKVGRRSKMYYLKLY